MKKLTFKIKGTTDIILHSDRYANPLDPLTKSHKELTSKRKKTDEDLENIAISEWRGGLYYDENDKDMGVYIPAENIEASIIASAKLNRLGAQFKRGLILMDTKCKLHFDGMTSLKNMIKNIGQYSITKSVVVSRARIMRTRPLFKNWSLEFTLAFNEEMVNECDIRNAVKTAGEFIGLCDWRPKYGRFEVVSVS